MYAHQHDIKGIVLYNPDPQPVISMSISGKRFSLFFVMIIRSFFIPGAKGHYLDHRRVSDHDLAPAFEYNNLAGLLTSWSANILLLSFRGMLSEGT
jgi:hypothetical protein